MPLSVRIIFFLILTPLSISCAQTLQPTTIGEINSFEDCTRAGFPITRSYPAQCHAHGKVYFQVIKNKPKIDLGSSDIAPCKDLCGDGQCQEIVCMAVGCPCAENSNNCPIDCKE